MMLPPFALVTMNDMILTKKTPLMHQLCDYLVHDFDDYIHHRLFADDSPTLVMVVASVACHRYCFYHPLPAALLDLLPIPPHNASLRHRYHVHTRREELEACSEPWRRSRKTLERMMY